MVPIGEPVVWRDRSDNCPEASPIHRFGAEDFVNQPAAIDRKGIEFRKAEHARVLAQHVRQHCRTAAAGADNKGWYAHLPPPLRVLARQSIEFKNVHSKVAGVDCNGRIKGAAFRECTLETGQAPHDNAVVQCRQSSDTAKTLFRDGHRSTSASRSAVEARRSTRFVVDWEKNVTN
jgi:hypothetical protein